MAAGCLCSITSRELHLRTDVYPIPLLVFFATLLLYNYQRIIKVAYIFGKNAAGSTGILNISLIQKIIIIAISFAVSLYLISGLPIEVLPVSLPFAIVALLYVTPLKKFSGLRYIPYMKLIIIAAIWVYATIILPVMVYDPNMILAGNLNFYMLHRFLFVAAITIPFDIRDKGIDQISMKTIPQIIGTRGAKVLAISMLVLTVIITLLPEARINNNYIIISVISIVLVYFAGQGRRDIYYFGLIDGTMILWWIMLL